LRCFQVTIPSARPVRVRSLANRCPRPPEPMPAESLTDVPDLNAHEDEAPADPRPTTGRWLATVCTYNERENLPLLVPAILEQMPEADLLVVDDNSPDGTGELADAMAAADAR